MSLMRRWRGMRVIEVSISLGKVVVFCGGIEKRWCWGMKPYLLSFVSLFFALNHVEMGYT